MKKKRAMAGAIALKVDCRVLPIREVGNATANSDPGTDA